MLRPALPILGPLGSLAIVLGIPASVVADTPPPPSYPVSEPSTAVSQADCIDGDWYLDTVDYAAQALAFVQALGVPMDSVEFTGQLHMSISNSRAVWSVDSNLVANASVMGIAISVPSEFSGSGEWAWVGPGVDDDTTEAENYAMVDEWLWGVPPVAPSGEVQLPPFFDPAVGMRLNCSGDLLTGQGDGAPLVGHFARGPSPDSAASPASDP